MNRPRIAAGLAAMALAATALTACGGSPAPLAWDADSAAYQVQHDAEQRARDTGLPEAVVGTVTCRDEGYDQGGWHAFDCTLPVLGQAKHIRLLADADGYHLAAS